DQYEYLEVYNYGPRALNLSSWLLSDGGSDVESLRGFNNSQTLIPPAGFAVITDEDSLLSLQSNVTHLSTGDGSLCTSGLSNTGETITLYDPFGREVDQLEYSSSWGGNGNDRSLEKINPEDENEAYNWGESTTSGGTPGGENSVIGVDVATSGVSTAVIATTSTLAAKCSDGTKLGACSKNRPMYCFDGILVLRCSKCGCPRNHECVEERCEKKTQDKKTNTTAETKEESEPDVKNDTPAFKNNTLKKIIPIEKTLEDEKPGAVDSVGEEFNATERQGEYFESFTGSAFYAKASNPKALATIAFSMLFGVYILRKKRKQDLSADSNSVLP
ncbi:MAG: lamin tail domain-containing protein, partial [Candidatus Altiarchaeales archaeon]|nr:lamin tail domain-containing protein [Candidatus Altiarchaeales archaeon]